MPFTVHLQSRATRPTASEDFASRTVRERLEPFSARVRRVGVRFDENVGARGELEHVCRIHITCASGRDAPSFTVEGRAVHEREAVELAATAAVGSVRELLTPGAPEGDAQTGAGEHLTAKRRTPRARKTANPPRKRGVHQTKVESAATAAFEPSAGRPSRKSTRKSENRSKRDAQQALRAKRAVSSPRARAERGN